VYPASFLEHAIDQRWLTNLAPADWRQIRYWKPQRMGDLISNFWD
jgi:hypothetical protein